jgi:hypothetical protein
MFTYNNDTWHTLSSIKVRSCLEDNGRRRLFPSVVEKYLKGDGASVAAVLRSEEPLSLEDIVAALEVTPHSPAATNIAMVVLRLVTLEAAELVHEPVQRDGG